MSILDPGEAPIEDVVEEPVAPPPAPVSTEPAASRPVCGTCRRPGIHLDRGWVHVDSRIDHPSNPAFCIYTPYTEQPVRWGFLNDGKKSQFEVSQGPSKVLDGWSGGGVK